MFCDVLSRGQVAQPCLPPTLLCGPWSRLFKSSHLCHRQIGWGDGIRREDDSDVRIRAGADYCDKHVVNLIEFFFVNNGCFAYLKTRSFLDLFNSLSILLVIFAHHHWVPLTFCRNQFICTIHGASISLPFCFDSFSTKLLHSFIISFISFLFSLQSFTYWNFFSKFEFVRNLRNNNRSKWK